MSDLDFTRFDAVTFDCYGTLIDWEQGILNALQPVLAPRGVDAGEDELLERYARHEAELEAGPTSATATSWRSRCAGSARELGFAPSDGDADGVCAGDRRLAGLSRHGARAAPPPRSGSGSA